MGTAWFYFARSFGFSDRLVQRCDRCGRIPPTSWWDPSNEVWEAVCGNLNGHRHGCFCINCFSKIASKKGVFIDWRPTLIDNASKEYRKGVE